MKRLFFVIITLVLFIPSIVRADMGAPEISSYDVTPKSMDGASYYNANGNKVGTIKNGEKVTVIYEYTYDGEYEGTILVGEEEYFIDLKEFRTVKDFYKPDEKDEGVVKVNSVSKVLAKKGLVMYKGPSEIYGEVGVTIPYDTDIKLTYRSSDIWAYTSYEGTEGWIMSYMGTIGEYTKANDEPLVLGLELELKDSLSSDAKVLTTIPAFERFYEYYELDAWAWSYYVSYNGVSGYIDYNSNIVPAYNEYINQNYIVNMDLTIYETAANRNQKVLGTLKKFSEFRIIGYLGHQADWYYIEYNGIKGFVESYIETNVDDLYLEFIIESDEYYDDLLKGKMSYEDYRKLSNGEIDKPIINDEEIDDKKPNNDDNKVPEVKPDEDDDKKEIITPQKDTKKNKMSSKDLVVLCLIVALVMALTAVVTIILVNKVNKKKEVKVVEKSNDAHEVIEETNLETQEVIQEDKKDM